jgi:hypothetical protein
MTPTKEQIEAAKKWVLENIDNAYGFEGTAEHVWLSDWLAEYAAHCTAEKDRQIKMLELKTSNSLANNLCPDHRDKQVGKSCLACTIEQKDAEIARLRIELGYYADENRWRSHEVLMCGHSGPSAAVRDGGRRARAALQEPTP